MTLREVAVNPTRSLNTQLICLKLPSHFLKRVHVIIKIGSRENPGRFMNESRTVGVNVTI